MSQISFQSEYPDLVLELEHDEKEYFPTCAKNIILNIDRNMTRHYLDHNSIGKLMTLRWLLIQNLNTRQN
ncbi:MAG: hypothetical protein ABJG41_18785 [Cyclobacteriaceae bacterium]